MIIVLLLAGAYYALQSTTLVKDWENRFQSNFYSLRFSFTELEAPTLPLVNFVINDHSLPPNSARSPINRRYMAEIIAKTAEHKPALVVLNILLDQKGNEKEDYLLAEAIKMAQNVVLKETSRFSVLPLFSKNALAKGNIRFRLDSAGVVQEVCDLPSSCMSNEILHRQIIRHYSGNEVEKQAVVKKGRAWKKINFKNQIPSLNVKDLFELPEKALEGKIILIGAGFPDLYLRYRPPYGSDGYVLHETELLAQVLNMVWEKQNFHTLSPLIVTIGFVLVLSVLSGLLVYSHILSYFVFAFTVPFTSFFLCAIGFAFYNLEVPYLQPFILYTLFVLLSLFLNSVNEKIGRLKTEIELKQSKIDLLTNELHSHHLFNELSRLSVMIRQAPDKAREYLIEFADMLRTSLKNADKKLVSLSEQISFLYSYIRQQEIVHGEELDFQISIDEGVNDFLAPWHVFFPLVENAVKYSENYLRQLEGGKVSIVINLQQQEDFLLFSVQNPFGEKGAVPSLRKGIRNLESRLAWAYPERKYQVASTQNDGSWIATVKLPLEQKK